jgi:hypothetical protein
MIHGRTEAETESRQPDQAIGTPSQFLATCPFNFQLLLTEFPLHTTASAFLLLFPSAFFTGVQRRLSAAVSTLQREVARFIWPSHVLPVASGDSTIKQRLFGIT